MTTQSSINKTNFFEATEANWTPISAAQVKEIMDAYSKFRRRRKQGNVIEACGQKLTVDFESEKSNSFFERRSLSFYFITENNSVIRISDHWSKTTGFERSEKFNCKFIRSCYWTVLDACQAAYYHVPAQNYASNLIGAECKFEDFKKL